MAISVPCSCGKKLSAPDNLAGKKARCPNCKKVLQIPAAAPAAKAPAAPPTAKAPAPANADPLADPSLNLDALTAGTPGEYDIDLPDDLFSTKPAPTKQRASAQPEAEAVPVRPVDSGRKCPACKEPMGEKDVVCGLCGFSPTANIYAGGSSRYATHDTRKSYGTLFGMDLNHVTISGLLAVLIAIGSVLFWFFTGPGAKYQVIKVQTVNRFVGLPNAGFEPDFVGGPGVITKRANPEYLPDGVKGEFHLGGTEQVVITRPNPNGDYVLAHITLSQGLLRGLKQESEYNVIFDSSQIKILGGPAPITPALAVMSLHDPQLKTQPPLRLSLAAAQTADHMFLVPGRVKPTSEDLKRDEYNKIVRGQMDFDGKAGIQGQLRFRCFHARAADQFSSDSISATGLLKVVDPNGMSADYSYNGYTLSLSWAGGKAWFTKDRYLKPQLPTDYHKYDIMLLFPRPQGVDKVTVQVAGLDVGRINIAAAARTSQPPPDFSQPSGEPLTDYLDAIFKARKKAMSVVSDSNLRQIRILLMDYVEKNHGFWPDRLEDVPGLEQNLKNPKTGEKMGYIYVMPAGNDRDIKNPEKTIVVYEADLNGMPMADGDVLYADGSIGKATGKK